MEQISEGLKEQFAKNIQLTVQQEGSKLRRTVLNESQDTETIHFETMDTFEAKPRHRSSLGYHDPSDATKLEKLEDLNTPRIYRRQMTCQSYYWRAVMDRNDKVNLLSDPTSKWVNMASWAMGRQQDRVILKAFADIVLGGREGKHNINFDILGHVVPVGVNLSNDGTLHPEYFNGGKIEEGEDLILARKVGGLTVEKLLQTHEILKRKALGANEKLYFVCTSKQVSDLLRDPQITSIDYNNVKALVSGEVNTFCGFNFVIFQDLQGILPSKHSRFMIRDCYAYTESAIRFATVKGSVLKSIDKLIEYHYAPSLYYSEDFGAARTDERKIVVVKCLEEYVNHEAWSCTSENKDHRKGFDAAVVPWQIFGKQPRTVDDKADITPKEIEEFAKSSVMLTKKKVSVNQ